MVKTYRSLFFILFFLVTSLLILLGIIISEEALNYASINGNANDAKTPQSNSHISSPEALSGPQRISTLVTAPTITPPLLPTETKIPTMRPTPDEGESQVIGYSVEDRPLEVYRFGQGEHVLLIIAGIHGGYEWNTVALAYQLINYFRSEPEHIPEDITLYIL